MSDFATDDLGTFLATNGFGTLGTDIFTDREPDETVTADPCITVQAGPSEPGLHTHDNPRPAIEYPRVRLTVRSKQALGAAKTIAADVYALLWQNEVVISGTRYLSLWPMYPPYPMGPDANDRQQVGFTVRMQRAA